MSGLELDVFYQVGKPGRQDVRGGAQLRDENLIRHCDGQKHVIRFLNTNQIFFLLTHLMICR
eukprot:m.47086 g.47086  ORF g.47086 m.47086 type:complete len:62 (+) comp33762_c0_seq2:671-856(+)